ncbi:hypothetical protein BKI52_31950 [marine bacterium AO1-C]|nr:hypothetical protein BKI52_31950 [marine bacterium AO1-C]
MYYISRLKVMIVLIGLISTLIQCSPNNSTSSKPKHLSEIDSLLKSPEVEAFSGAVLVAKKDSTIYLETAGFADIANQVVLTKDHQFVIGSISKQITAVMVLQAYERKELDLNKVIRAYLPKLPQPWADTVTVHHLLTHMHGIEALNKPLNFEPGSRFEYSQLGYDLLAKILEKVTGKTFADLAAELFAQCKMMNTYHPQRKKEAKLAKGYTAKPNGELVFETSSFRNYVAAGSFISNVEDMVRWNQQLYQGKLLKPATYQLMSTRYATRQHPIFGEIDYGYGLTFEKNESKIKIGALGFAPGYVSANFYFPQTQTSVIILQNTARYLPDFKKTFFYQTKILDIVKKGITEN